MPRKRRDKNLTKEEAKAAKEKAKADQKTDRTRGPDELGRVWIRRINDAVERLDFRERTRRANTALEVITVLDQVLPKQTYLDLHAALPVFEDQVCSILPELPAPDVKTTVAVKIIDMLGEEVLVTADV